MLRRLTLRPRRAISGTVALEFGLLLPTILLILVGSMDLGRLIWTYTTLQRSVEAAARCAAINQILCGTPAQIANRATEEAWGLSITSEMIAAQTQACGARVSADYDFALLVPWIGGDGPEDAPLSITLTVTACYPT